MVRNDDGEDDRVEAHRDEQVDEALDEPGQPEDEVTQTHHPHGLLKRHRWQGCQSKGEHSCKLFSY